MFTYTNSETNTSSLINKDFSVNLYSKVPDKRGNDKLLLENKASDDFDKKFGFDTFKGPGKKFAWLSNLKPKTIAKGIMGAELYFIEEDGNTFKVFYEFKPYFYILIKDLPSFQLQSATFSTMETLKNKFQDKSTFEIVDKLDLDMPDHWDRKRRIIKASFNNFDDLQFVKREISKSINTSKRLDNTREKYQLISNEQKTLTSSNLFKFVDGIREHDVPYCTRLSIDREVFVGSWYTISYDKVPGHEAKGDVLNLEKQQVFQKPTLKILAFDIECAKAPLKFPDPKQESDEIYMISYMVDGQGYLIVNRSVVSEEIGNFEYTPKAEFPGFFEVFNCKDENETLVKFFSHCQKERPGVYVTYNGDFFDFWYIEIRAERYGLSMKEEIGFHNVKKGTLTKEYRSRFATHIDCLYWVKRDSYLPAGSRGLKKVSQAKLGFDPVEIHPEDMLDYAKEKPYEMATYSVSDALCTYYLFEKYIRNFIFSLCTIIPLEADEVLRKGSGTLCEMLLMIEAYKNDVVCPNKSVKPLESFYKDSRLIENETYVGGHVEGIESGVFRDDIEYDFSISDEAVDYLISNVERDLNFAVEVENKKSMEDTENFEEVVAEIKKQLTAMKERKKLFEKPKIYHLDVSAMYPNIILTNRLQPSSIVAENTCNKCRYSSGGCNIQGEKGNGSNMCQRKLDWVWRGDIMSIKKNELENLKNQLMAEKIENKLYKHLARADQTKILRSRLKQYCQKNYAKAKETIVETRSGIVCQRENSFYVDTVRSFRDRRYEYKGLVKKSFKAKMKLVQQQKDESSPAKKEDLGVQIQQMSDQVVLYDSLQLAHKCILNSFYGYVMRQGSRWFSMEMAAMVTHTGANIIKEAKKLIEGVGRVLELDTDGVWCMLPISFPENFKVKLKTGGSLSISYPCVILNSLTAEKFTNPQYQTLITGSKRAEEYSMKSECSIEFEVDGPYKCMVIPSSQEEGKILKKRYAVFNLDKSLAELKGFELKRRGELGIVKQYQSQCFSKFLDGETLQQCYDSVATSSISWLNIILTKGENFSDAEILDLLAEDRSLSKSLKEYGQQKSNNITAATRLTEFLRLEESDSSGLNCKLIIAKEPVGFATSARAIPCAIFSADPNIRETYIKKWTHSSKTSLREVIDWDYYFERLSTVMLKVVCIPAILQGLENPIPLVPLPKWVQRIINDRNGPKQQKLTNFFSVLSGNTSKRVFPDRKLWKKPQTVEVEKEMESLKENAQPFELHDNFSTWLNERKKLWFRNRNLGRIKQTTSFRDRWVQDHRSNKEQYWQIINIEKTISQRRSKIVQTFKVEVLKDRTYLHKFIEVPQNHSIIDVIAQLGCVCHPKPQGLLTEKRKRLNSGLKGSRMNPYLIDELKMLSTKNNKYLPNDRVQKIFVYQWNSNQSYFTAAFLPKVNTGKVHFRGISIADEVRVVLWTNLESQNLEQSDLWKSATESLGFDWKTPVTLSLGSIIKERPFSPAELSEVASKYAFSKGKNIVIATNSLKLFSLNRRDQLHIKIKVPYLYPLKVEDANLDFLQVGKALLKHSVKQLFEQELAWKNLLAASKYSQIPVNMLGDDFAESMFACFFARQYQKHQMGKPLKTKSTGLSELKIDKLWSVKAEKKKTQIKKQNENLLVRRLLDDTRSPLRISHPGFYQSYAVEIHVNNLVLCSIVKSQELLGREGNKLEGFSSKFAEAEGFFLVLRSLISTFVEHAQEKRNSFAEVMLESLHRMITDPTYVYYNKHLDSLIDIISDKLFLEVLQHCKNMGAKVILGQKRKSKILLETKACSFEEAKESVSKLISAIKSVDVCKYLLFNVTEYHRNLIVLDEVNWAGLCTADNETLKLDERLSLAQKLPPVLKRMFFNIIDQILRVPVEQNLDDNSFLTFLIEDLQPKILKFLGNRLRDLKMQAMYTKHEFSGQLSREDLHRFVVLVSNFMKLTGCNQAQTVIQRNSLKLINQPSYLVEDLSRNKIAPVKVKDYTCRSCFHVFDIDVSPEEKSYGTEFFYCIECETEVDSHILETRIIEQYQNFYQKIFLFDLQCSCRMPLNYAKTLLGNSVSHPSPEKLAIQTESHASITEENVDKLFDQFRKISEVYNFNILKEIIDVHFEG
eukprot:maker-scaffold_16-snap-gene-6.20-mRNA-1 protein AED:0.04 eAED:0.04 QI:0/0/0/1/1/1/3/0/2111